MLSLAIPVVKSYAVRAMSDPSRPPKASQSAAEADLGQAQIFSPDVGADGYAMTGLGGASQDQPVKAKAPPVAASPAEAQGRLLAETVVSSFVGRLTSEAKRRGGALTVQDLDELSGEFAQKTEALKLVFEKSLEQFARDQSAAPISADQRCNPFERLVIKKIERLFDDEAPLSRRFLPGFFTSMSMMLGADNIEHHEQNCEAIVVRLRAAAGGTFGWNALYTDATANAVALDAVVGMALYFDDSPKRSAWLVGIINGHLAPAIEGAPDAEWQLELSMMPRILQTLFADIAEALMTEQGRARIAETHGADACGRLETVLDRIEKWDGSE